MAVLVAAVGLAVGSFLNVAIGRLRSGETGFRSRSRCPKCQTVLRPRDLVPVLSFFALRGRCRSCKEPISWQYPLIEFSTMALFLAAYAVERGMGGFVEQPLRLARDLVFIAGLTIVFVVDLKDMVVFDSVTLPLAAIAFVLNLALGRTAMNLLMAAAIGAGFFLLQYALSKGRWIGGGDIRIGAMMGAMLGFPGILLALLVAYVAGASVAVFLLASRKAAWSGQIAFGTFLSAATVFTLFFGQPLITWYVSLVGL